MGALEGKIALITGASRGIGAAVAKRYAREGAKLILAARSTDRLEKVDDEIKAKNPDANVTLVPIDLEYPIQIDEMIRSIAGRFGGLDILVGNAGVLGGLTPITHQDPKDWKQVMDINLHANWHLLRCADPLLQKSQAGRALFVTSGVARGPHPYWGAYAVSKAALEFMIQTYAEENKTTNVRANLVDPGVVGTDMLKHAKPGLDQSTIPQPDDITDVFVKLGSSNCQSNGDILAV